MNKIKLFEEWSDTLKVPNPLAESICKTLDKYGVKWEDTTSKARRSRGGFKIMIPFAEAIKFFKSDYFTESRLVHMKPYDRRIVTMARAINAPVSPEFNQHIRRFYNGEVKVNGVTFVISISGTIRLWLDSHRKISSNDNVDIDPNSSKEIDLGTTKFLTRTLVQNMEGHVVRYLLDNIVDITSIDDSILKNQKLVIQVIRKFQENKKAIDRDLANKIIELFHKDYYVLRNLLPVINLPELVQKISDLPELDHSSIYYDLAINPIATTDVIKKSIGRLTREYQINDALTKVNLSSKDLKDMYFDEETSDSARTAIKSNPNFGDIVGDEGGILSDWF
jgi:hypothetical protein